jgi:hypothetical protein
VSSLNTFDRERRKGLRSIERCQYERHGTSHEGPLSGHADATVRERAASAPLISGSNEATSMIRRGVVLHIFAGC